MNKKTAFGKARQFGGKSKAAHGKGGAGNAKPARPFSGERKPRREFDGERPARPFNGERKPRREFDGERPARLFSGERKPRREFDGERPARPFNGERKPRREFDGDRPARPFSGERKPRREFDGDRPARPFSGERKPRREFDGDRPARPFNGERKPRREFDGDRPARPFNGERKPRREFDGDRPARPFSGERKPRREFDGERPARPFSGERKPRREFDGERPARPFNGERKPRREFDGGRKPRRDFDSARKAPRETVRIDWSEPLNARQAAVQTLHAVVFEQQSLNGLLESTKAQVREPDQALYQALVYGVLREYPALSKLRDSFLKEPPSEEQAFLGIILNVGIYQLLRLSLGDHGVLNETVELAKSNGIGNATGLINAILRNVQREREASRHLLDKFRIYNVPAWLASAQRSALVALAEINRLQPPLTLRIRGERAQWLAENPELGAENPLHAQAVTLHSGMNVQDIAGFNAGQVSVQDASAQCAATLLNPQNGERILDACAAPGGKTGHLLELAPQAQVLALDVSETRLQKVQNNLSRLGLTAQCLAADAAEIEQWWDGEAFDAVLLDAPCSGSGVLRRHPDIAFVRSAEDLKQLPKTQMRLLRQIWQTLKPKGRLLYTTCSILPRENQQLIEQFLMLQSDARLRPTELPHCQDTGFGMLHLPDADGDGFFYALLEKTED